MTDPAHTQEEVDAQLALTGVLSELVGEDKKFKTPEDLAKGKKEADSFIDKLKDENKTLRTLLEQATTNIDRQTLLEKLMSNIDDQNNNTNEQNKQIPDNQLKSLSTEDIVKLMEQREQARIAQANYEKAISEVKKVQGEKTDEYIASVAQKLGLTVETLKGLAQASPQAFLNTIGHSNRPNSTQSMTNGGTNSQAVLDTSNPDSGVRNQAYYNKLQKEMGTTKFVLDYRLQAQLHRDMQALGDAWD